MSIEALKLARGVISSINQGKQHALTVNDETVFWQREEWVRWALDEVLPAIEQAIEHAQKQAALDRMADNARELGLGLHEKQEPVALKHRLVKIHDALCNELGDTDPYIDEDMTDEEICEELPVFWAAKEIAGLIGDAPWTDYTSPPQRQPLTHEQRFDLLTKFEPHKNKWEAPAILIDMVEQAHGIKGEQK